MAGKDDRPRIVIEKVTLGKVWDARECADVPGWAADALERGIGSRADVVRKGENAFRARPTFDSIDFDEEAGELSARFTVAIIDPRGSLKGSVGQKNAGLKKVDARSLQKKLRALVEAAAEATGKDLAKEVTDLAGR